MKAADWEPYLPTPPFPSYVSGHSRFCAAWAQVMTLAMASSELNFRATLEHLYVEERKLVPPVTLDYPTYAAAAEACGQSRIFGGIHFPGDNERGLALGRSVGENAWSRAQQFVLGIASPAAAALASLHPPLWFPRSEEVGGGATFPDASGLAIDVPRGGAGGWRSIPLDPMPVGAYELTLSVEVSGDGPIRLRVAIEPSDAPGAAPLAAREVVVSAAGYNAIVTLPWTSDDARSFAFAMTAAANTAAARLRVDAIDLIRVWPIVAGSPASSSPASRAERSNDAHSPVWTDPCPCPRWR